MIGAVSLGLAINSLAAAADRFGFSGREIFPIENQISQLHVADLDGDGLNDIVVANNARAKLTLLYNQTGKTNLASKPGPGGRREINELPPDARFRLASLASEKRITALAVADLNSDGRPDLAYYGDPAELVVLYNEGSTNWSVPRRWPLDDGQLTQNALATGDLNGDGRTDVALLSENCVYILFQQADQTLGEPQKLPFQARLDPSRSWMWMAMAAAIFCWWNGGIATRFASAGKRPTAGWGRKSTLPRLPSAPTGRTALMRGGRFR